MNKLIQIDDDKWINVDLVVAIRPSHTSYAESEIEMLGSEKEVMSSWTPARVAYGINTNGGVLPAVG